MEKAGRYKAIIYFICFVGSLGGLLFGLDQGFIANSLQTIKDVYQLDVRAAEQYSAILATGGVIGALLAGAMARILGRKKSLVVAGLLFILGAAISSVLPPFHILYICRFFLGFAIGVVSFISPLYLAETAPASIRGSMGSLFQLMITIGIFLISATNVSIEAIVPNEHHSLTLMFLVIAFFALCMLVGSLTLPESPRWLMLKGKKEAALKVIQRTAGTHSEADLEVKEIEQTLQSSRIGLLRSIFKSFFLKVLFIGVFLQMFQQLVGINVMIYYAPTIFGYVGMKGILVKMAIPTVNMLFTLPAIYLVEKWGRKKLLYAGAVIMCLSMVSAGLAFQFIGEISNPAMIPLIWKRMLISSCILYIFGFAFSWGPVAWLICSEIFPLKERESGMTITTMVNWTFAGIVMRYALSFMEVYGNSSLFYLFAAFCILSILFVAIFVPETRGITLEKLEEKLKRT